METEDEDLAARSRQRVTSYFRCLTCVFKPIRERSHFRNNEHRKQKLCEEERAAWIADQRKQKYPSDAATEPKHRARWDTSRRKQSRLKRVLRTKSQQYFRCLTCTGQPIRPKSHFRYYKAKMEKHHKQRLSRRDRSAWIAERMFGSTNDKEPVVLPQGDQTWCDEFQAVASQQHHAVSQYTASAVQRDVTQAIKAKYRQYYRCLTCSGQPIRPKSHFRYHAQRREQHRRQTLSPGDRTCWIAAKMSQLNEHNGPKISHTGHTRNTSTGQTSRITRKGTYAGCTLTDLLRRHRPEFPAGVQQTAQEKV